MTGARERRCTLRAPAPGTLARAYRGFTRVGHVGPTRTNVPRVRPTCALRVSRTSEHSAPRTPHTACPPTLPCATHHATHQPDHAPHARQAARQAQGFLSNRRRQLIGRRPGQERHPQPNARGGRRAGRAGADQPDRDTPHALLQDHVRAATRTRRRAAASAHTPVALVVTLSCSDALSD